MNCNIRKTSKTTARIAFESTPDLDPKVKPRIHRCYQSEGEYSPMDDGLAIGHGTGNTCILVVNSRANDIIVITEKHRDSNELHWRSFRIGCDFIPIALDTKNRPLSRVEICKMLQQLSHGSSDPLTYDEDQMKELLKQRHPLWLQTIVSRLIEGWRIGSPDKYFRLVPWAMTISDLERCVDHAPYLALSDWKSHLSEPQFDQCILSSPNGAVRYAADRIPQSLREKYFTKHASDALQYAFQTLTEHEIDLCSTMSSSYALRWRHLYEERKRAILLASAYTEATFEGFNESMIDFRTEVISSLKNHPTVWLAAHPGGFASIIECLHLFLEIRFDAAELEKLFQEIAPNGKPALALHLASKL